MTQNATLIATLPSLAREFPATWDGAEIEEGADLADELYFSVRDPQLKAAFAAGETASLRLRLNEDPSVECEAEFDASALAVVPLKTLEEARSWAARRRAKP